MNKTTSAGNKRWYIGLSLILGLLSTAIGVFVFITGKNAPDLLHPTQTAEVPPINPIGNPVKAEGSPASPTGDLLSQYFPLFVGSTKTYTVGQKIAQEGAGEGTVEKVSTFTEQVIMVESSGNEGLHIYKVEQTGEIFDLDCGDFIQPASGTVNKWYLTTENALYVACSEAEKNQITGLLYAKYILKTPIPEDKIPLPKIVFPLEINSQWSAFAYVTPVPGDKDYMWYVETAAPVQTAAGNFADCFKVVLYTLPDTSYKYICKGIGLAAYEYHHHGTTADYRVELKSFSSLGSP